MPLTDTAIRKATPRDRPYKLADGGGLFLWVQPGGGKWWRYKYRFAGKEKLLARGTYPDVTLADARERHLQARRMLAAGRDPAEAKNEAKRLTIQKHENTFEAVAREWHRNRLAKWTPAHAKKIMKRL